MLLLLLSHVCSWITKVYEFPRQSEGRSERICAFRRKSLVSLHVAWTQCVLIPPPCSTHTDACTLCHTVARRRPLCLRGILSACTLILLIDRHRSQAACSTSAESYAEASRVSGDITSNVVSYRKVTGVVNVPQLLFWHLTVIRFRHRI